MKKYYEAGFSTVEVAMAFTIAALVALIAVPTFIGLQADATKIPLQSDLLATATEVEVFYKDNGRYPTDLEIEDTVGILTPGNTIVLKTVTAGSSSQVCLEGSRTEGSEEIVYSYNLLTREMKAEACTADTIVEFGAGSSASEADLENREVPN